MRTPFAHAQVFYYWMHLDERLDFRRGAMLLTSPAVSLKGTPRPPPPSEGLLKVTEKGTSVEPHQAAVDSLLFQDQIAG